MSNVNVARIDRARAATTLGVPSAFAWSILSGLASAVDDVDVHNAAATTRRPLVVDARYAVS